LIPSSPRIPIETQPQPKLRIFSHTFSSAHLPSRAHPDPTPLKFHSSPSPTQYLSSPPSIPHANALLPIQMKYPLLPFSPNHIQLYAQPAPCPSLSLPHHLRRSLAPNAPPVHITSAIPNTRNTIRVLHAFFTSSYRSDAHLPGGHPTLVPNTLLPISAHSPSPHHSIPFLCMSTRVFFHG
jgi:hypothetical protein